MFYLRFSDKIKYVNKINKDEFMPYHNEVLAQIKFDEGNLIIPNNEWYSTLLGAGEEKAVFCICDHNNRVFAVEVIDEKHYLNGRFIGGTYFFNMRVKNLINKKFNPNSLIGLTFTGLIKVREYVYGYEWDRFSFNQTKKGFLDSILTYWLQSHLIDQFKSYQKCYKDVHGRNVIFEVCDIKEKGIIAIIKDLSGKTKFVKIKLQAIDVR